MFAGSLLDPSPNMCNNGTSQRGPCFVPSAPLFKLIPVKFFVSAKGDDLPERHLSWEGLGILGEEHNRVLLL